MKDRKNHHCVCVHACAFSLHVTQAPNMPYKQKQVLGASLLPTWHQLSESSAQIFCLCLARQENHTT